MILIPIVWNMSCYLDKSLWRLTCQCYLLQIVKVWAGCVAAFSDDFLGVGSNQYLLLKDDGEIEGSKFLLTDLVHSWPMHQVNNYRSSCLLVCVQSFMQAFVTYLFQIFEKWVIVDGYGWWWRWLKNKWYQFQTFSSSLFGIYRTITGCLQLWS